MMLASSLKGLERDGFVKRVQYQEMPVRAAEYSITDVSKQLIATLQIIGQWGRELSQIKIK